MPKLPSTWTLRYDAGMDWRNVEVGVMGERNESVSLADFASPIEDGAGMW